MDIGKLLRILLLLLLSSVIESVSAQNSKLPFSIYSNYISKVYDISWKKPKGFSNLDTTAYWGPCGKGSSTLSYNFIFRSKDADCIIMYPNIGLTYFPKDKIRVMDAKRLIYGDLGCVGEDGALQENASRVFEKYVTVLSSDDAKKLFHSDSVYICIIPLKQPYRNKYPYCTGIYVCKQNRPGMYFKCFFTERGKQKENEYLGKLNKAIRYRNENWRYDEEEYVQENYKLYLNKGKAM